MVRSLPSSLASQVKNLLLVASISKTLATSGTRALSESNTPPLSESLVLQILKRTPLDAHTKLDFFKWVSSLRPNFKHSPRTYSQIFHTLCRANMLDEIAPLLISMKRDGVVVDYSTFKFLLDCFLRSGNFDSALEILDVMEELGTSLNPLMYNSVLVALVKKNQIGLALSMFDKMVESVIPNAFTCNELFVALRREGMREEFKRVFERLREKGFGFDLWGYNICIYAFGCWGELGVSLKLFREMKEKDLCTYNSMIHVLCVVGKAKDALVVWDELKGASGLEPDSCTYRILVQGCCKAYRVDNAISVFREMQYNNHNPDTVVYNSLLDGLLKVRKVTDACQLFEKMVQDGVRASCWTYNILIDGLFKNGRGAAGYMLFCDLKKKGQFVDGITYSIVVLHLCREGQLEGALDLVEEMEARGFAVDLVTVTSLLIGLHRQGRWDWAERLMKHVRESNLVPNILRWRADMEAAMKAPQDRSKDYLPLFPYEGDYAEILRFLSSSAGSGDSVKSNIESPQEDEVNPLSGWSDSPYMDQMANEALSVDHSRLFSVSRGRRVQEKGFQSFDIDMINTYMSIYLSKGKLSIACKIFEIFTQTGSDPISYTYNSLMSSFVKKGYFKEAWGVLRQMEEKLCPADIATYNVIIQGLGKMGKTDLARAVLDRLMETGGYLDIVMYNTLIHAFGKAGRIDEANKLFEQMTSSGINPDVVTFNTLIEVHTRAGKVKEAYKFLKKMLDAGCSPNHVTDTTLDFLEKEIDKVRYQKASIKRNEDDL